MCIIIITIVHSIYHIHLYTTVILLELTLSSLLLGIKIGLVLLGDNIASKNHKDSSSSELNILKNYNYRGIKIYFPCNLYLNRTKRTKNYDYNKIEIEQQFAPTNPGPCVSTVFWSLSFFLLIEWVDMKCMNYMKCFLYINAYSL